MATAISQWKGLEMSHAYAVASNIKQRGLKPKRITDNVITDEVLTKIANDLAEITGLMFEIKFDKNTETWQ
jgi:predicted Zn-dependent protease